VTPQFGPAFVNMAVSWAKRSGISAAALRKAGAGQRAEAGWPAVKGQNEADDRLPTCAGYASDCLATASARSLLRNRRSPGWSYSCDSEYVAVPLLQADALIRAPGPWPHYRWLTPTRSSVCRPTRRHGIRRSL
jgi:hypothetical protein